MQKLSYNLLIQKMTKVVTRSLKKQLEQVKHQHVSKLAQKQDQQQMQPMGNKRVNVPNTNATQRGEVNEQHQNVVKWIV
jgi:hypothetical protein